MRLPHVSDGRRCHLDRAFNVLAQSNDPPMRFLGMASPHFIRGMIRHQPPDGRGIWAYTTMLVCFIFEPISLLFWPFTVFYAALKNNSLKPRRPTLWWQKTGLGLRKDQDYQRMAGGPGRSGHLREILRAWLEFTATALVTGPNLLPCNSTLTIKSETFNHGHNCKRWTIGGRILRWDEGLQTVSMQCGVQ